jgi:hypothetical protein
MPLQCYSMINISRNLTKSTNHLYNPGKKGQGTDGKRTKVLVEGAGELVECRGHLEPLLEDAALALDAHDLGPLDEAVEVLLGRQRSTDPELLRPLLE